MTRMSRHQPFLIAAAVILLDIATKLIIRARVSAWDNLVVIPGFFSIVHSENPGAAFGMFAESSSAMRPFFLVALSLGVIAYITFLLLRPGPSGIGSGPLVRPALGLVLGGAFGNVIDRAIRGTVTDFLEFYFGSYTFPAFNVADSAITVGASLLILDMWMGSAREKQEHAPQTD